LIPALRAASISASHHLDAKKPSLSAASTSFERRTAPAIASLLICSTWLRCVVGLKMTLSYALIKVLRAWKTCMVVWGGIGHSSLCALVYRGSVHKRSRPSLRSRVSPVGA